MWVKQRHKPSSWEWFIPSIYGDLGDGLSLFYPRCTDPGQKNVFCSQTHT